MLAVIADAIQHHHLRPLSLQLTCRPFQHRVVRQIGTGHGETGRRRQPLPFACLLADLLRYRHHNADPMLADNGGNQRRNNAIRLQQQRAFGVQSAKFSGA
ncbi:hypothetical protein D3C78_1496000 [compost metagenome]